MARICDACRPSGDRRASDADRICHRLDADPRAPRPRARHNESVHPEFWLTDDQRALRDLVRQVARERIEPLAAHVDETEAYPGDQLKVLAEQGVMGLWIPEAYGGTDLGVTGFCLAVEEIARACASTAVVFLVQFAAGYPLVVAGTEDQKRRYLPRLASGEITTAFSLSESGAGSDAASIATTALRAGDRYLLSGTKMWVTNGSHAGVLTVFATVDRGRGRRGITAFLVEPTFPGFAIGKLERKMGIRGSPTAAIHLTDCEVPIENRLGEEGDGFRLALGALERSRPAVAAQAAGIAQAALDAAVAYARERHQFGQPIASFQGVQFMLADMAMHVHASRLMVHHAAASIDRGAPTTALESSMAKCFASDSAMRVATDAVQIFGGYGYTREYPVERLMRDAKITQIYEGTNQVQRLVIARELGAGARG
ncbi:MAG: acyl-CoA dehydrogenase family protein [Candidatus Rokubacteria bacterium]|nr:acyl-CoA dehydrogenase family protein [Candidatus Rokubacteria bacterium]